MTQLWNKCVDSRRLLLLRITYQFQSLQSELLYQVSVKNNNIIQFWRQTIIVQEILIQSDPDKLSGWNVINLPSSGWLKNKEMISSGYKQTNPDILRKFCLSIEIWSSANAEYGQKQIQIQPDWSRCPEKFLEKSHFADNFNQVYHLQSELSYPALSG